MTLRQGNQDDAVRAVQSGLATRGYSIAVDGDYGPEIAGAVSAYQSARGLPSTGVVDYYKWRALVGGI